MTADELVTLAEQHGAEVGRYEGKAVWIKVHQPSIESLAAALPSPPPEPKTVGGGLTEERIIAAARNRDLLGPERASESDLIYFARDIAAMAAAPAPALKGRAAIVEAWNNLNHAVRLLPGLDALYRACLACDDATPSQDLTPGGSGEAIITEAEAAKSGERIAWLRERLDTPEKRRNWRAAQAAPSADVPVAKETK